MSSTVTLSASAKYGYGGKQFVARITGRHPKFTFAYEFLGKRSGKRNDYTEAQVDDAGLYMERDIDKNGSHDETFYVVYDHEDGSLSKISVPKSEAMSLAKRLPDVVDWHREALPHRIAFHQCAIADNTSPSLDLNAEQRLSGDMGSLKAGYHTRGAIIEERRKLLVKLERLLSGEPEPVAAIDWSQPRPHDEREGTLIDALALLIKERGLVRALLVLQSAAVGADVVVDLPFVVTDEAEDGGYSIGHQFKYQQPGETSDAWLASIERSIRGKQVAGELTLDEPEYQHPGAEFLAEMAKLEAQMTELGAAEAKK